MQLVGLLAMRAVLTGKPADTAASFDRSSASRLGGRGSLTCNHGFGLLNNVPYAHVFSAVFAVFVSHMQFLNNSRHRNQVAGADQR